MMYGESSSLSFVGDKKIHTVHGNSDALRQDEAIAAFKDRHLSHRVELEEILRQLTESDIDNLKIEIVLLSNCLQDSAARVPLILDLASIRIYCGNTIRRRCRAFRKSFCLLGILLD